MSAPPPLPPPGPTAPPVPQALQIPTVRVNLLPDSIRAEENAQRSRLIAAGCVAGSAVVVGLLYFLAMSDANSAQEELDAALVVQSQLQQEAVRYDSVPAAYDAVAAAQTSLTQAMAR